MAHEHGLGLHRQLLLFGNSFSRKEVAHHPCDKRGHTDLTRAVPTLTQGGEGAMLTEGGSRGRAAL
eukprot:1140892-Pelagomonas_calceolata.AAC.12